MVKKKIKWFLLGMSIILLTACGSNSSSNDSSVKVDITNLQIDKIKNQELNLDYICRANDEMEIIGSNLLQDSDISLNFIEINGTITRVESIDESNKHITFKCPDLVEGYREFYLGYEDKNSSFYNIQFIDSATPIINNLSFNNNMLTIEGKDLKQLFTLHVDETNIEVDNSQGSDDIINHIEIPKNTISGYIYLENNSKQSNSKYLNMKIEKNGQVDFQNQNLDLSKLVVWTGMEDEIAVNTNGKFDILVNKENSELVVAEIKHNDSDETSYFLSSIIFLDEEKINLNYISSAVAMVWSRLAVDERIDKDKWRDVRNQISKLQGVINLSLYIRKILESDPYSFSYEDAEFKEKFSIALEETKNIIAKVNKNQKIYQKYLFRSSAQVTPQDGLDGIKVYEKDDGSGDIILKNDTMLYISAEIKDINGTILKPHSLNKYIGLGATNPQYSFLFIANEEIMKVYDKSYTINVLTAGTDNYKKNYYKYCNSEVFGALRAKTLIDQFFWPYFAKTIFGEENKNIFFAFVKDNFTGGVDSVYSQLHDDSLGALKNMYQSVCNDISGKVANKSVKMAKGKLRKVLIDKYGEDFEEKLLRKFSRQLSKKIVKSFAKGASKFAEYAYDFVKVGNFFHDLKNVDAEMDFDVKFVFEIENITPNTVVPNGEDVTFEINGTGFPRDLDMNFAYENEVFDLDNYYIKEDGTEINLRVSGTLLKNLYDDYIKDSGGSLSLEIYPYGKYDKRTIKKDAISFNNIQLTSISPSSSKVREDVVIVGIGFSNIPDNNEVTIGGKVATIIRSSKDRDMTEFYIRVPSSLDVGEYEVKVRNKDTNEVSNGLKFTVLNENSKWITPTKSVCEENGGVYYQDDIDYCSSHFKDAKRMCNVLGGVLPSIKTSEEVIINCGGELANGEDSADIWNATIERNNANETYQACYRKKGFSSMNWSSDVADSSHTFFVNFQYGYSIHPNYYRSAPNGSMLGVCCMRGVD